MRPDEPNMSAVRVRDRGTLLTLLPIFCTYPLHVTIAHVAFL